MSKKQDDVRIAVPPDVNLEEALTCFDPAASESERIER